MGASYRPAIEAYIGASGSGKGLSIRRRLAELQPARLLVWDPMDEYSDVARRAATVGQVVEAFRAAAGGPLRLRYVPGGAGKLGDAFAALCVTAFAAGDLTFLAEELSDVTGPSWAPPAWRRLTTQGRHRQLVILGAAQRPALIDKTYMGNCTLVRCGALSYDDDCQVMARNLRVGLDVVQGLASEDLPGGGARLTMLELRRRERATEVVTLTVNSAGKTTEKREPLGLSPLREAPGHVNAKRVTVRPVSSSTGRKAKP